MRCYLFLVLLIFTILYITSVDTSHVTLYSLSMLAHAGLAHRRDKMDNQRQLEGNDIMNASGHIWDAISESAKDAIAAIKVPGFGNPPQGYDYDGKPFIPSSLIPHWSLTEYDARCVMMWIEQARNLADGHDRQNCLTNASDAARRIVSRVVSDLAD